MISKYTCCCKYNNQRNTWFFGITDEKLHDGKVMEQMVEQVL
jgi:hypothetical protein